MWRANEKKKKKKEAFHNVNFNSNNIFVLKNSNH